MTWLSAGLWEDAGGDVGSNKAATKWVCTSTTSKVAPASASQVLAKFSHLRSKEEVWSLLNNWLSSNIQVTNGRPPPASYFGRVPLATWTSRTSAKTKTCDQREVGGPERRRKRWLWGQQVAKKSASRLAYCCSIFPLFGNQHCHQYGAWSENEKVDRRWVAEAVVS